MKVSKLDEMKAIRRGSREAEIENATGFISKHRVHKNKKAYSRKSIRTRKRIHVRTNPGKNRNPLNLNICQDSM